ncbi:Annulin [Amphibalanus amphitrite]|uniref:protein-glutamine gamma-glutamyltransferase n=1 Tax=Amphibalanus amphitrite TaxID=1232801 RepID=A0A6A4W5K7_AMPAM|nr:Annulin [Amphibalanus amphitrite]
MGQCFSRQRHKREYFSINRADKSDIVLPKPATSDLASQPLLDGALAVAELDLCVRTNGADHCTAVYQRGLRRRALVVRRGQPFHICVRFNRKYTEERDHISLIFTVDAADVPSVGHGTLEAVPVTPEDEAPTGAWHAHIAENEGDKITLRVTSSASSIVGKWRLEVDTRTGDHSLNYSHPTLVYMLFNPWCSEDAVYLPEPAERREYVESDAGLLYRGSHSRPRPCPWSYGQYEADVLDCSLAVVGRAICNRLADRADPVLVVRAVSAMVNHCDEDGVLVGNWSGEYAGGTAPTRWQGSVQILQQYHRTGRPVKFGQCWVFAGVSTTVCRALGIPCRPVTNYSSAHDTHGSLTIDVFYDSEGEPIERLNRDSTWNFHVWNEAWMLRPDLESAASRVSYDGWQAFDATPQEISEGRYACGPCALQAVRNGEVKRAFDVGFVFAEVNADRVFWKYSGPRQPLKLLLTERADVGKAVVTKALGEWTHEDLTSKYKHDEETDVERRTMLNALRETGHVFSRFYLNEELEDIHCDFALNDDIVIGQTFHVTLRVENRSEDRPYTVSAHLRVDTQLYTGRTGQFVKKNNYRFQVEPGNEEEISMPVSYDEYYDQLVDQSAFRIAAIVGVVDTDYEYFASDDFRVRKPDIRIELDGHPSVGAELRVIAEFNNPLPTRLTRGRFLLEGGGLTEPVKIKVNKTVGPYEPVRAVATIVPWSAGEHLLAAKFYSKQLNDVDGFLRILVKPRLENTGSILEDGSTELGRM